MSAPPPPSNPPFSFGGTGGTGGTGGGFSFGASAAPATATAPAAPTFSFGGATTAAPAAAAKPTGGFSFGGAAPAAASSGGFSFGTPAAAKPATAPTTTITNLTLGTTGSAAAGFTLPSTPTGAASTTTMGAASTTTTTSGAATAKPTFSFGTPAPNAPAQSPLTLSALKTPAPAGTAIGAAAPATPTPAFGLKAPTKPDASQPAAAPTTTAPLKPPATTDAQKPTATATTTQEPKKVEILTQLRGKTMEEILNEWQADLSHSVSQFHAKATDIARLDTKLLDNADKIYRLVVETQNLQSVQTGLNATLDFIEAQQSQLNTDLDQFEERLQQLVQQSSSSGQRVSAEETRERTYELAEQANTELNTLGEQMNEMIAFINKLPGGGGGKGGDGLAAGTGGDDTKNPVVLMTKILNEQFNTLTAVENNVSLLDKRLAEVKLQADRSAATAATTSPPRWL